MKPDKYYADQAKWSPALHDKAIDVENVMLNRKTSRGVMNQTFNLNNTMYNTSTTNVLNLGKQLSEVVSIPDVM